MAMADIRNWNEDEYRASIVAEGASTTSTVFAVDFAPTRSLAPDRVTTASSDGSVAIYPIDMPSQSLLSHGLEEKEFCRCQWNAKPLLRLSPHDGPAYNLLTVGKGENALLLSCGDDGCIQGWLWQEIDGAISKGRDHLRANLELRNPQQRGPQSALLPVPETNALASDPEGKHIFSAAGDGCAYTWDLIITGSEDGTCKVWDCRSGFCVATLDSWNATKSAKMAVQKRPWVSCMALDPSENWLVCGNGGNCGTLWNLPVLEAATRIVTLAAPQAVAFTKDQIVVAGAWPRVSRFSFGGTLLSQVTCAPYSTFSISVHPSGITAVGGYGGIVDILSEFGSHLTTFSCK
ncbi:hypothetical protein O6H91_02G054400 [Diphasiastrum complanatum]|uniref:Uncharacterized protein n=1 Tax=Diphasiastrum complanatum TaxID=34168 RepID=A0ACC2EFJ0_DIPCM|nr:hypothetical protein O6H91_02G054400 [Diphasiastrum complanatum]